MFPSIFVFIWLYSIRKNVVFRITKFLRLEILLNYKCRQNDDQINLSTYVQNSITYDELTSELLRQSIAQQTFIFVSNSSDLE